MEAREGRGGVEKRRVRLFGVSIVRDVSEDEEDEEEDMDVGDGDGVKAEVLRKSKSMGNLASADHGSGEDGYLSDGGLAKPGKRRRGAGPRGHERKKGVPWTEEEHRTFLAGLEKLGKGDWRGISRKFVTSRTPTQVASHAQKYFIRQTMASNKKRRSSLFDVVINDAVQASTSGTDSTLPWAKTPEIPNDIRPIFQDNKKRELSGLGSTETASNGPQLPPSPQFVTNPIGGVSKPCLLNNVGGVSGSTEEEKQMPAAPKLSAMLQKISYPPLPPDIAPQPQVVNPHPAAFSPEFLQLFPCRPPQASAAYPLNETSDLELSIAPPKVCTV
ncbi:hypothetical protein Taro_028396 [Colocasia esculenta]|uniref:Uncharacterized protein n=1 Tax=Colocasia esculenta TaxID=4460 RepID=A0A843VX48_COLES|nr:hypothetical protein [Colocasia esculenta]